MLLCQPRYSLHIITTQLQTAQRVDVVFDTYIQNSLKSTTRQKRGKGVRRRVADAVQKGFQKVMVHTVDTNVVVLAIAMFNQIGADELWLAFGTRSNFRYIPVHDVVAGMDPRICATLPVFHALTG